MAGDDFYDARGEQEVFGDLPDGPAAIGGDGVELFVGKAGEVVEDAGAGVFCLYGQFLFIDLHSRIFFFCKVGNYCLPGRGVFPTINREFATNA